MKRVLCRFVSQMRIGILTKVIVLKHIASLFIFQKLMTFLHVFLNTKIFKTIIKINYHFFEDHKVLTINRQRKSNQSTLKVK
jgi:hypothetical protein